MRWLALVAPLCAGEPLGTHQRACVSGQLCGVHDVVGTGLGDGDRLLLAHTCGVGTKVPGMPGALGETLPARGDGVSMDWTGHITPDGGTYRLCWCSVASLCNGFDEFSTDIGTMTITGPHSSTVWSCTSGRTCALENVGGMLLRDGDSVMALSACGGVPVDGFPNGAKAAGSLGGSRHDFAGGSLSALGGTYTLCWCAQGATCIDGGHHRKQLGSVTVIGPNGQGALVCSVFADCTWGQAAGEGLQDGDQILLLDACGIGPTPSGFNGAATAVAGVYSLGIITPSGGAYDMCWCGAGGACASAEDFLTRAGTLTVRGPQRDHHVSCVHGGECEVPHFYGVGLASSDRLRVRILCSTIATVSGFEALASPAGSGFSPWPAPLAAPIGDYRLCWCGLDWDCAVEENFKMDSGELRVVAVDAGQERACQMMAGCRIDGLSGSGLRPGDLMMVRTACGAGVDVPGWPRGGLSEPATDGGASFSWGLAARVEAAVGSYRMCWCPANHFSGCNEAADFTVDAGTITLRGPQWMGKNASCVAHQRPSCLVGPFAGLGLSAGSDRVALTSLGGVCGVDPRDPRVDAATDSRVVGSDGLVEWPAGTLPFGGEWKICYCAGYDSPLDDDSQACSSTEDFAGAAGVLAVQGAFLDQGANCTRNQLCTFSIRGQGLNRDTNFLALHDGACGSSEAMQFAGAFAANPLQAGTILDGELVFTVGPLQTLTTFRLCFCVPVAASGLCDSATLTDFAQDVGFLDIRGAAADQSWVCGSGGRCTILIQGHHLSTDDRVKIVATGRTCDDRAESSGFFRPLALAEPAPATTEVAATFALGQVTALGSFQVCYCAGLDSCDAMDEYNHKAGDLLIVEPLTSLSLVHTSAASITMAVTSSIAGGGSKVRCATSLYMPVAIPNAAEISEGISLVGLGTGESLEPTVQGTNLVEIMLVAFTLSQQQYRVWCVETSAQSFIIPNSRTGFLVTTPGGLQVPRARAYPAFLWSQARFYVELFQVDDEVLNADRASTLVRIASAPTETMCNTLSYSLASSMHVSNSGSVGIGDVVLLSNETLSASRWQRYVCFFAGPNATGVALVNDPLSVQDAAPGFWLQRLDGQVMRRLYRGVLMQVQLQDVATTDGLMHWVSSAEHMAHGCDGVVRSAPPAHVVYGSNTSFFHFDDAPGEYVLCYLGDRAESSTPAPFNDIGSFEVVDALTAIEQHAGLPSTRSTVRLQLEVRLPGNVTCLVLTDPADVQPQDFLSGTGFEGRAELTVPVPTAVLDPEAPRWFFLIVPLLRYQRTVGPVRVWCHHSLANNLVFPANRSGTEITLQEEEPHVHSVPPFLWHGARFFLRFFGTPPIQTMMVRMHEPALPAGWRREEVVEAGVRTLKYFSATEETEAHPVYSSFLQGRGPSPCEDSNASWTTAVKAEGFTRTDTWFEAQASSPFVCYWPMEGSLPHLIGVLDLRAQSPEYLLEVEGEERSFVYRGVAVNIHLQHGSPVGGRILVVRKPHFDFWEGACQELPRQVWLQRPGLLSRRMHSPGLATRRLRSRRLQSSGLCTRKVRGTVELKLAAVQSLFPADVWGATFAPGLNCSRDFKLYRHPAMANITVLANVDTGVYFLVMSNSSALLQLLPNVGAISPNGGVPISYEAIVHESFSTLSNYSGEQWAFSVQDCAAEALLAPVNPMYEEGAEDLPLSLYLKAALSLGDLDFMSLVFLPYANTVASQDAVCDILQARAPQPDREETVFDIDQPGLGRTVVDGQVWVPSRVNDTGTFLHYDALGEYVLCYVGNDEEEAGEGARRLNHLSPKLANLDMPLFNPIGAPFSSRDVLAPLSLALDSASTSLSGYLSVLSELQGTVRCIALLRNANPPTDPDDIFQPDLNSEAIAGVSELVQFDAPDMRLTVPLSFDQAKAKYITPVQTFVGAPPTVFVWCAHRSSTVFYPYDNRGFALELQARPPPAFEFRQLNRSTSVLQLTLLLQFTPIVVHWSDSLFPVNPHDEVRFAARPAMPKGLVLDPKTGAISGVPEVQLDGELRTIVAQSIYPPYAHSSADVEIQVDDVLGLRFTFANAERAVLSMRPRSTNIFHPSHVFLLTRSRAEPFTKQPSEFFCSSLAELPGGNSTLLQCSVAERSCCCIGVLLPHLPTQDARISAAQCGLEAKSKYHTMGMVQGMLLTTEEIRVPARLASIYIPEFLLPAEALPEEKSPVLFNLIVQRPYEEYLADLNRINAKLVREIAAVIEIPEELVLINKAVNSKGVVSFEVSFYVEPRCLERISAQVEIISFGIDIREGCSFVSPTAYMNELKSQLSDSTSMLFYRDDFELLREVDVDRSFTYARVMHFCTREPFWEFGAMVEAAADCPLDSLKVGAWALVSSTIALMLFLAALAYLSHECVVCAALAKLRAMDLLTPLLGLYTTIADFAWLAQLRSGNVHPIHGLFVTTGFIHLAACLLVNFVAVRATVGAHIVDTPWWRRNHARLRWLLVLSLGYPRVLRFTRASVAGLDQTQIHFGTPSKMAIVFANLGLVCLLQDVPQLLLQIYVWLIWRSTGPRLSLVCFALGALAIATSLLHHIFSRSQRAAYERVVKLLGVRRLTAGFFDVSSSAQQVALGQLENVRRADGKGPLDLQHESEAEELRANEFLDPSKLDPIQAAMYVSKMYDKETRAQQQEVVQAESTSSDDVEADVAGLKDKLDREAEEDSEEEEEEEEEEEDSESSY